VIALLDEHSTPSLRSHIGRLLTTAHHADVAVRNIRLAALDFTFEEMRAVRHCRLLLGRLEATGLSELRHGRDQAALDAVSPGGVAVQMEALLEFLDSGRIEIRSASLGAWAPDFSVFHFAGDRSLCLLGAHYFHEPPFTLGPSFTAALRDPDAVRTAAARFAEIWARSHDVMHPVRHAIIGALHAR
jgi:hypothetical protein